jgi:outer membrane protein OmpA-like peptidoglycan-associated protein
MMRDDGMTTWRRPLGKAACAALTALALASCESEAPFPREVPSTARPVQEAPPRKAQAPGPAYVPPQNVASAGPLAQAGIDKYMDGLELDLRHRLRGIAVMRKGEDIVVVLPDALLFEGTALGASGKAWLGALALSLRRFDHTAVQVNGFTDNRADEETNLAVSGKHAGLVAGALAQDGVAPARLAAHGLGSADPRVTRAEGVGEPKNRRVELRVTARPG